VTARRFRRQRFRKSKRHGLLAKVTFQKGGRKRTGRRLFKRGARMKYVIAGQKNQKERMSPKAPRVTRGDKPNRRLENRERFPAD